MKYTSQTLNASEVLNHHLEMRRPVLLHFAQIPGVQKVLPLVKNELNEGRGWLFSVL
jgi:hypothetical protein